MGSSPQPTFCPICKKSAARRPENTAHPFCSRRCKLLDLGAWFDESYSVPVVGSFDDAELASFSDDNDDGYN